ncbi:fructose-6-phosphate aldolase [Candidatus Peregrinibacteria bacterium]|nr:fructose-6-phosphate aldolase [Candidatus Peregrinibacteria bacterium]
MKLFMDTANVDHVAEVAGWGVLDGVTTNPSLVAKEGKEFKPTVLAMCKLVPSVSAQVTATDFEGMKKQGEEYASWHKHVVVKVPMTVEGLKALHYFRSKNIRTNTTLVFSVNQAILAAKAGANIISPFIGRLDDIGEEGMDLIAEIVHAWSFYKFDTEVLVASIRHPRHVAQAAALGAHISTIPYDVFKKLPQHTLTDVGLKKFLEDWERAKKLQVV